MDILTGFGEAKEFYDNGDIDSIILHHIFKRLGTHVNCSIGDISGMYKLRNFFQKYTFKMEYLNNRKFSYFFWAMFLYFLRFKKYRTCNLIMWLGHNVRRLVS